MQLEVVTIGDELLLGFTIDTNAAHLARVLAAELVLYPLALELVASGKSHITTGGTVHNEVVVLPNVHFIVPQPRPAPPVKPNEVEPGR